MSSQLPAFTLPQQWGVWSAFKGQCFWCSEPLEWRGLTIDHVIPRIVLADLARFEALKTYYSLPASFEIHSFENWVPSHLRCNGSKNDWILLPSPAAVALFANVSNRAIEARRAAETIGSDWHIARISTNILTANKSGTLSSNAIEQILESLVVVIETIPPSERPLTLRLTSALMAEIDGSGVNLVTVEAVEAVPALDQVRLIVRDEDGNVTRDSADE